MKNKIKLGFLAISFGLFFLLFIVDSYNLRDINSRENNPFDNINPIERDIAPKQSNSWTFQSIHIDDSGSSGNGTWGAWAEGEPWCSGSGTWGLPYIIENIMIDTGGTGNGILIANSSVYFIIRNCTLYNSGTGTFDGGIKLYNTNNSQLFNNTCSNTNMNGILLENGCDNNTINGNTANNNMQIGIFLHNGCNNNTLSGNTVNENTLSGILLYGGCNNNTLSGNTANGNTQNGIEIDANCNNNNLWNNTIIGNIGYGIVIYSSNNNNKVIGNILNNNALGWIVDNGGGTISFMNSVDGVFTPIIIDDTGSLTWREAIEWSERLELIPQFEGDGTRGNPYIIEDLVIDAGGKGNGILIANSSVYFIIRNCTLHNSGTTEFLNGGIKLYNTDNGQLINNTCSNTNLIGILLLNGCDNNTINGNTATNNFNFGLRLENNCSFNTISNNNFSASGIHDSILLYIGCNNNTIINNFLDYSGRSGIRIESGCNNNTLLGNTANNNTLTGISLAMNCHNNTISGNIANSNIYGIYIYDNCDNNIISGNTANGNTDYGIYIDDNSDNNTISGNTANDNTDYGIVLDFNSDNNTLWNNTIIGNIGYGLIICYSCYNNKVIGNILNNNGLGIADDGTETLIFMNSVDNIFTPIIIDDLGVTTGSLTWVEAVKWDLQLQGNGSWSNPYIIEDLVIDAEGTGNGILISNSSMYFIIRNCTLYNSGTDTYDAGIKLYNTDNGQLIDNTCSKPNMNGILLLNGCNNNTLSGNTASNNTLMGILLENNCHNNTLSGNTVNDNMQHGIYLYSSMEHNIISGNTVNGNTQNGIYIQLSCDSNQISYNILTDNTKAGIVVQGASESNIVCQNEIKGSERGIHMFQLSDRNFISNNIIDTCTFGVMINNSNRNIVYYNIFYNVEICFIEDDNCDDTKLVGNLCNPIPEEEQEEEGDDDEAPPINDWLWLVMLLTMLLLALLTGFLILIRSNRSLKDEMVKLKMRVVSEPPEKPKEQPKGPKSSLKISSKNEPKNPPVKVNPKK